MRFKVVPEDFAVEEQLLRPARDSGPYTLYRIHKQAVTTLDVQARLASALHRPLSAVSLPALKDKDAVAIQYATVLGEGPPCIRGRGFVAERCGRMEHHLTPSDLLGNRFTITVRRLSANEVQQFNLRLQEWATGGLPNYFDQQRFGSQTASGDFPGRLILLRDAEEALRVHLAEPLVGDPSGLRAFKRMAAQQWGRWDVLLDAAPRPSNIRSVLTFLRDHPTDFRRALNLVNPRVLSLYLNAYQSLLWNRITARYLLACLRQPDGWITLARERLPIFRDLRSRLPTDASLPLPHHRAVYPEPVMASVMRQVLEQEGLRQSDLKPRLLRRAYLPQGDRRLILVPTVVRAGPPAPDEWFPGWQKVVLTLDLPPGAYATLILKVLALAPRCSPPEPPPKPARR